MCGVTLYYVVCGDTVTAYVAAAFRKLHKTFFRMRTSKKVQATLKADPFSLVSSCKKFFGIPEVDINKFSLLGHKENHSIIQVGRSLCRSLVQSHAQDMGSTLKSDQVSWGLSSWAFRTSKDRDCTACSLGSLLHYWSVLLSVSFTGLF